MKRIVAGLTLVGLLALVTVPASADGRGHRGHHRHGGHRGGGHFVGGLAVGALTGVIVGGLLAPRVVYPAPPVAYEPAPVYVPPAPVYAAPPPPVYVAPPPPVCRDYWVGDQYQGGVWVQGHWERVCR
jgi:hypothetical protein